MSGSSIIGKNWRRNSLQWSGHVFEAIGLNILDHLVRVEHFTIHGDINSGWFALDGAQGAADIEDGVAYMPTESGDLTYTVTGIDATTTCENEATIDITVNALPEVVANASPEVLCDGEELTLTGSGATIYTWDMGVDDGVTIGCTAIGSSESVVINVLKANLK